MKRVKIKSVENSMFPRLWDMYETAFPLCERRPMEDQIRIFKLSDYHLHAWTENENLLGFIGWWEFSGIRYVEHYAINPNYQSQGFGKKFLSEWIKDNDFFVLLEIEPAIDEITKRRENFYSNLGFVNNNIVHIQPPYHKGTNGVNFWIMSYPTAVSEKNYNNFVAKQRTEIILPFND